MYKKIAVEEGLTNVVQALKASGFHTTPLEEGDLYNVQAVIVKGDSSPDMLDSREGGIRIPVISAVGRSAEEVVEVVRDRLS